MEKVVDGTGGGMTGAWKVVAYRMSGLYERSGYVLCEGSGTGLWGAWFVIVTVAEGLASIGCCCCSIWLVITLMVGRLTLSALQTIGIVGWLVLGLDLFGWDRY